VLATGSPAELKARTGAANLDAAFIQLLPEAQRAGHRALTLPARTVAPGGAPASRPRLSLCASATSPPSIA